jgi:type II secretory pathway pseudopilin PulG
VTGRDRIVLIVVLVAAAIVGSWLLVIQPKRSEAGKLGDQLKAAQAQLQSAQAQVQEGEAAKSSFASNYTTMARLGEAVPADDNVPSLIYQLQSAASAARVDFRDLAVSPGAGGSTTSAFPQSSPSAAQAATAALPPGATVGSAGFPIEPFTFTFRGNFFHLADFLGRVQRFVVANNNRVSVSGRLLTLNAISLGAGPQGFPQITASISANAYLVPASQGVMAGATTAGPAAAAVSTTTTTPSSGATPTSSTSTPATAAPAAVATPAK